MAPTAATPSSDSILRHIFEAFEVIREDYPQIPLQTMATFFAIALNEGLGVTDLEKQLSMPLSSASRNAAVLSDRPRRGQRGTEPGLGLIQYQADPKDFRRDRLHLTKRGRALTNRIADVFRDICRERS
jgi:DNA-binding MarR family transcriptional regulator